MINAVIFDWAGTTVDFGCFAPLNVFVEIFKNKGIEITSREAREPMGMLKIDHVRAILSMPRISKLWLEKIARPFNENDVKELYADFEPALMSILPKYTDIIDGVIPVCAELRDRGIKIGSTTGYTAKMMDVVAAEAAKKGYSPDSVVTADEAGKGRPFPFMIYRNMQNLGLSSSKSVIKAGDTVADIQEGVNAGVWSVGIIKGSSEMGLTENEYFALPDDEKQKIEEHVKKTFFDAGADYVINKITELPALIDKINGDRKHILLTPGPLTTTKTVKEAMLKDLCTWDDDYKNIIQKLRGDLVKLALRRDREDYTAVLMQGSGTFAVESVIGTVIGPNGKLLVVSNGAYGDRIAEMAKMLKIDTIIQDGNEDAPIDLAVLQENLKNNPDITHVAAVHCETTTGILNDIEAIGKIVKQHNKIFIVDAMSSFGGVPMDISELRIDYLISSANKCIQGVPGFGFVIAKKAELLKCSGYARSLSLDLFSQWMSMEKDGGKWRFTSPTHVVAAFCQAVAELEQEGGIATRHARFKNNQKILASGMKKIGFAPLLPDEMRSPVITSFCYPKNSGFSFARFYDFLKRSGFIIYPGKISKAPTFRIGNIGDVHEKDIVELLSAIEAYTQLHACAQIPTPISQYTAPVLAGQKAV